MTTERKVDYRAALEKLPPDEQEKYRSTWREHLGGLSRGAYLGQLTKLTRQFGPEFTSSLIQPELITEKAEPPPITEVPAAAIEPEIPWYQKPFQWAAEQPVLQPIMKGLENYYQGYITPAAMTVAGPMAPKMREQLAGRSPFALERSEREEIWGESGLPWLAKTATELAVDPLSYFGWGLAPKAMKAAKAAGYGKLAAALKPAASLEEAYIRAAAVPVKAVGKGIKKLPAIVPDTAEFVATGKLKFHKPLDESARSIINNLPTHTYDMLHNLGLAGEITGKPLSQILESIKMGIPDTELFRTIVSPQQKRALEYLVKNANKLDLDMLIRTADKHPDRIAAIIGQRQVGLVTKELSLPAPRLAPGILGSFQKMANKLYSTWKPMVLQSPYYVLQNTVENPIRELLMGVRPLFDITDYAKLPSFGNHPMDIQRRIVSLSDRWNKTLPQHLASPFARTPATGGVTEAVTGAIATGKKFPASTVAAYMDDAGIVNTYFNYHNRFTKSLMETSSKETAAALAKITGLYDDAIRVNTKPSTIRLYHGKALGKKLKAPPSDRFFVTNDKKLATEYFGDVHFIDLPEDDALRLLKADPEIEGVAGRKLTGMESLLHEKSGSATLPSDYYGKLKPISQATSIEPPIIEEKLLEHLKHTAQSGSVDDVLNVFQEIQRNKTLTVSRAMNELEKGLPGVIRDKIKIELPRLWAKNDIQGINKLFENLQRTLPEHIESYQKQVMVQRLKAYRDLLRSSVPKKYQPFVTKVINSFKLDRVSEAEAKIASSKSLSEFQQAMFKASLASRRELEALAEATMITEAIARGVDDKVLSAWYATGQQINQKAFKAGEELVDHTFSTANVLRFAKDPKAIQNSWDGFIMNIQSEFPEIAESLRVMTTPDADSLWSAYRSIQERRWFNVGQEKLHAMGIDFSQFPRVIGADGKLLTQEDFLKSQLQALRGWEDRIVKAWDKRHTTPTAKNKLLDNLREQTVKVKEGISLQERQIQNEAAEMALDVTYTTFGNYAQRTNLDDFMQGIGVPFWFFPSRSIPFYTTQMIQRPRLGIEVMNLQSESERSEQPSRLFGTLNIPGTDFWYNPLQSTMLWQLADRRNFVPAAMGGLEQGESWIRNNLAVSLGPQWRLATALVERVMGKQTGETVLTMEPQPLIPQQRWLDAVAGLKIPAISPIAALLNEPFDMFLRAVYGDDVANWQKREVEKTIVDMGYNPQTASDEVIEEAWNKYYIRQLLSIPGGAIKEMTPTEMARFEAINQKAKELDLTGEQRVILRQMGESPFTGLRNDQIEAIYADVPAQKLWRYIRPWGLTTKSKPIWSDYIAFKLGRETLLYGADRDNPTKGSRLYKEFQYDDALRKGQISPREWKSLYRQNYADYISKVQQLDADNPLSPKTDADWEAYRVLLGWDEPVRHPDDIKLDEYYEVMDSTNFENELGEFDYSAYRKAEQAFFSKLSPDTITYIKARKDRYKSPTRAAYTRDMEKVQPYYALQDAILAKYPPEVAQIIEYALASPDAAIQRAILVGHPEAMVAMRRIRIAKARLRRQNPGIDRILRFWSR